MPNQNDLDIEFSPASVIAGINAINKARALMEKDFQRGSEAMSTAVESFSRKLTTVNDRAVQSQSRLVRSIEQQSAAYGRTGVEHLIAQRDSIIKRLGDEEKSVQRVTAAYAKMIEVEKARAGSSGGHGFSSPGFLALRGARDLFEGRTAYGEVMVGRSIAGLSGMAAVFAGTAAGLAAVATAGAAAVKSLAEYGTQVKDIELRTGLNSREVSQFSFAARAVGAEPNVTERLMRGLSQAMEDMSPAGEKARRTISDLGISTHNVNGELKPTGALLLEISRAFEHLPPGVQLSKDAMDLFKRVGIDTIPFLKELRSNVDYFEKHGLPSPEQDQIERWSEYQKRMAAVGVVWDNLLRSIKDPAAKLFLGAVGALGSVTSAPGDAAAYLRRGLSQGPFAGLGGSPLLGPGGLPISAAPTGSASAAHAFAAYMSGEGGVEGARARLNVLKQQLDEARASGQSILGPSALNADVYSKQRSAIEGARAAYERQSDIVKELEKDESRRISHLEKIRDLIFEGSQALVGGSGRGQFIVTGQEVYDANRESLRRSLGPTLRRPGEYRPIGNEFGADAINLPEGMQGLGTFVSPLASRSSSTVQDEIDKARGVGIIEAERQLREVRLSAIAAESAATVRLLEFRGEHGEEIETARNVAAVRLAALNAETQLTGDTVKRREEALQIELDMSLRIAEVQKRQFESISHATADLYTTLFTHPSGFGRQLGTTVRDATLRPITQGLGDMTARFLQPLIFGAGGAGGISGALHGAFGGTRTGPIGTFNDPVAVAVVGAGGGGGFSSGGFSGLAGGGILGTGGIGGGGGSFPFSGLSMPTGGFGFPGAPGGTSGFAGPVGLSGGGGGGGGLLGGILGGGTSNGAGGFNLGSLKGSLANLKDFVFNPEGPVNTAGWKGNLAGVVGSPAAGIGGMFLAQQSLLGRGAGTIGGIFGGAAGGALLGFQAGGPLGAAIGAGVGAAIGIGEKLAGVESLRQHAKNLVSSTYHVSISNSMADQIVGIAKSRYGGTVSIAVRSPEVREMLGLYAAGTGQAGSFPQSATMPHGASFVESGGALMQAATYQYGNPYVQNSPFPNYGGVSGGMYPSPGGDTYMSFNIQGDNVSRFFDGNVFSPDRVQGKFSSAMQSSNGRVANALALSEPGTIVS